MVALIHEGFDPLAAFTAPPPGETRAQKVVREKKEAEAKRISDKIDEDLRNERAQLKKQRSIVRVLLLGQSESGKSTTLKNFRMRYARSDWKRERASWKAVIQLNLIRSIITIVELIQAELDGQAAVDDHSNDHNDSTAASAPVMLTNEHRLLKLRLGPLRHVEAELKQKLGAGSFEEDMDVDQAATPFESKKELSNSTAGRTKELMVRGWKDVLDRSGVTKSNKGATSTDGVESDEATDVIANCREYMKALWSDEAVRALLKEHKRRLEHSAGFFLDDLDRIATRSYTPTDDDIIRARLRTLGVQEYRLHFEHRAPQFMAMSHEPTTEWIIYDVGGSRTSRHAWLPYFDNVNAIIFLAPISCFDEQLAEDPNVNRVEDSLILWKAICSSKLLSRTTMIVFLNKCDLLRRKLRSGIKVADHWPGFGDRSNDTATVVRYMREKFVDIAQHSAGSRNIYFYSTSVIDTKATANTIKTVRDGILREHLKHANFV